MSMLPQYLIYFFCGQVKQDYVEDREAEVERQLETCSGKDVSDRLKMASPVPLKLMFSS